MEELAGRLRSRVDAAAARFREWPEERASRSRGEGKWIAKEILGHLADSAANNHQRFARARFTTPFAFPGYDQNAWVALHDYRDRPWRELVELWVALNRQVAAAMASVPPEKLETPCRIGESEEHSLEWLMRDYLRHLEHHLEQLEGA